MLSNRYLILAHNYTQLEITNYAFDIDAKLIPKSTEYQLEELYVE